MWNNNEWNYLKWQLFITSFFPLWISILVSYAIDIYIINSIDTQDSRVIIIVFSIIIVTILLISYLGINKFLSEINKSNNNEKCKIIKASKEKVISTEFLLAYILPLIAFDFTVLKDVIMFSVFFIILAIICIRNNNVYTNIYFEAIGYKIYCCDIEHKVANRVVTYGDSIIISNKDLTLEESNEIPVFKFDNNYYIKAEEKKNDEQANT